MAHKRISFNITAVCFNEEERKEVEYGLRLSLQYLRGKEVWIWETSVDDLVTHGIFVNNLVIPARFLYKNIQIAIHTATVSISSLI